MNRHAPPFVLVLAIAFTITFLPSLQQHALGNSIAGAQFVVSSVSSRAALLCDDQGGYPFVQEICTDKDGQHSDVCTSGNITDWWDPTWKFRLPMAVKNSGPVEIPSGYVVSFSLNHQSLVASGQSLANGNDVRVIHGSSQLERVALTPFNTVSTVIHARLTEPVPVGGEDTYYLYYGNPSAGNPPDDPLAVYLFFDDFDDGDLVGWFKDAGTWEVSNGAAISQSVDGRLRHLTFLPEITGKGVQYWYRAYPGNSNGILSLSKDITSASPGFWTMFESPSRLTRHQGGYQNICLLSTSTSSSTWYDVHVTKTANGQWTLSTKTPLGESSCSGVDQTDLGTSLRLVLYSSNAAGALWDDIRFSPFLDPEPIVQAGGEQILENTVVEFSCLQGACVGATTDCSALGKVCNDGMCVDPPMHLECNNFQCVSVIGVGPDGCADVSDCKGHLECVSLTCTPVPEPGEDKCPVDGLNCLPDIIITDFSASVGSPVNATLYNITMQLIVQNHGFLSSASAYHRVNISNITLYFQDGGMNPGDTLNMTKTVLLPAGFYPSWAFADFFGAVQEANENNNNVTASFTV
ncbi:MAG: DUF2341 domain-containing protein [Candidatus Aenigmarchaeota archaeon]|nr:DUF2341 domain-containing protein [Candidatus Aenigmarchaeota archaeon]